MLNKESKDSYYIVDKYGLMIQSENTSSRGDAISTSFEAYIAYDDISFVDAILSCWSFDTEGGIKVKRHPEYTKDNISRDHIIYSLLAFKINSRNGIVKIISKLLKFRISETTTMTPSLFLWMKGLNSSIYAFLYQLWMLPQILFYIALNRSIYTIFKLGEECHQKDWEYKPDRKKAAKLLFPIYAMHILAWQLYILPRNMFNKLCRGFLLKIVPKHNYVIKMLLGDKNIKVNDVYNYLPMRGGRFTTTLNNKVNDRWLEVLKGYPSYNEKDKDYVINIHQNYYTH